MENITSRDYTETVSLGNDLMNTIKIWNLSNSDNVTYITQNNAVSVTEVYKVINDTFTEVSVNVSNVTSPANVVFSHIPKYEVPVMVTICIVLSVMILATIMGNVFVIAAIILERSLQGVSNYLILSLAVTDLLVAACVMPLSLVHEISVNWFLGNTVCDLWISCDVLCCTASILHLVAISLDRFWGVSNIDYIRRRSAKQILKMIAAVWFVAFAISIPPLFGWKEEQNNPEKYGQCIISQNLAYTVFSTVGAFYLPLVLMVFLNFKIYIVARSRIRKKNFGKNRNIPPSNVTCADMKTLNRTSSCSDEDGYTVCNGNLAVTTALNEELRASNVENVPSLPSNTGVCLTVPIQKSLFVKRSNGHVEPADISCTTHMTEIPESPSPTVHPAVAKHADNNNHKNEMLKLKKKRRDADRKRKDKMEMKRERKAAKVLGIITGAFIACWLPFFVLAVLAPFCAEYCSIPNIAFSLCLWLGYFNSTLNPILYTIFNPSFRKAFQKIMYGKYRARG
ncbi:G-protein coupled receptor [Mactra antiquata]